jgi:hypothetical protein
MDVAQMVYNHGEDRITEDLQTERRRRNAVEESSERVHKRIQEAASANEFPESGCHLREPIQYQSESTSL